MAARISPLAHVDPRAELDEDVEIGPFCLVGPHVRLGAGCRLFNHVTITGHTTIGRNNRFHANAVIGDEPQDLSYTGALTRLEIGDDNIFREGVTVHRGAEKEDHATRIGNRNLLMVNSHVAHNCVLRDRVVLVNGVQVGGHVHIHDGAIISGNAAVHPFCTVGTLALVTGCTKVSVDVPPYMVATGHELRIVSVNVVGLRRNGVGEDLIRTLKRAHRKIFREVKTLDVFRAEFTEALGNPAGWPPQLHTFLAALEFQRTGKNGRGGESRRSPPHSPELPNRKAA